MISLQELFFIFFRIGGLTLGGGYVMVPILEDEIVHKREWLTETEFIDILAVAQSFPGALIVNTGLYVGYKLKGIRGALVTCLGVILPPMFIIIGAAALILEYGQHPVALKVFQGIRPAVAGLIIGAVLRLSKGIDKTIFNFVLAGVAFILVAFLNIHPIFVIVSAGSLGFYLNHRTKGDAS